MRYLDEANWDRALRIGLGIVQLVLGWGDLVRRVLRSTLLWYTPTPDSATLRDSDAVVLSLEARIRRAQGGSRPS